MSETLQFTVRGTPRPKSRPRFVKGRVISTANPHEKLWNKAVRTAAWAAVLFRGDPAPVFRGPVRVRMVFTFVPPPTEAQRVGTPHTQKPDCDNIAKAVADQMVKARVIADDSLIAEWPVEKWWGERPGVVVTVDPLSRAAQAPTNAAEDDPPGWLAANR